MTADHRPASYTEYLANVSKRAARVATDRLLDFIRRDGDLDEIEAAYTLSSRFPDLFESSRAAAEAHERDS